MRLHRGALTEFLPGIDCDSRPCVPQPQAAAMDSSAQVARPSIADRSVNEVSFYRAAMAPSHCRSTSLCDPRDSATTLTLQAPTQRIVAARLKSLSRKSAIGGARADGT